MVVVVKHSMLRTKQVSHDLTCTLMDISPKRYLMKLENVVFGYNPKRIENSNYSWIIDLRQHMTSWGSELFSFFQISIKVELVKLRYQHACPEVALLTFNLGLEDREG